MSPKKYLRLLNISVFLQTQFFLLPVLFLFYQHCGLSTGDYFLFQGIFSLSALIFEIPLGYLADVFSKKTVLILSYSFFIARLLLWIFFAQYGYWILLTGEILYAAQKAAFSGTSDSYIYEFLKFYNIPQTMLKYYGKMNFFLSIGASLSSLIGAWLYDYISSEFGQNYGFMVLLTLELTLNLSAVYLLTLLPKIPHRTHSRKTLTQSYQECFRIITWTIKNQNIKYHIFYSGLLASTTLIFIWSFQPIMKLLLIPVSMNGVVYFVNHLFRALAGLYLDKIRHFLSLSKMSLLIFILFSICFILTFGILNIQSIPLYLSLFYFTFVSFTIGIQCTYLLSHVSRIHIFTPPHIRTTVSSVNTTVGRLYAAFFFILIKILLDGTQLINSLAICFIIFILVSVSLKKVYFISLKEDKKNLA